jgi:mRNA interferase MazF
LSAPGRGEVWLADLNPTRGHEQAGRRPVLVVSDDLFNRGPAGLAIVLPMTSTVRNVPSHVPVAPPEGGVETRTAILCEGVRSISVERLAVRWGVVSRQTMATVEDCLRILLRL